MSIYYTGCATAIIPPDCTDCPTKELAGIRSIWLQKSTYTFTDISDPTEWATAIQAGDVYVYPFTRGSLEVAETESPGFGDNSTTVDGYEFTLNAVDPNYTGNCASWKSLRKNKSLLVGYRTETQIHLSEKTVSISPMAPIAEDVKAGVYWNVKIKWSQDDPSCPVDMPTGVFEACIGY